MCDRFGRWRTIHVQNLLFILGSLVTGGANSITTLCAGRFIVGIASAISGIACVPYLTEISPAADRGWLSSQYEILVCLGILLAFCSDLVFSTINNGWRVAFIIPAVIAFLQSLSMCWLPDSPKWLIEKGRIEEAKIAIEQIYGTQYLLYEIDSVFSTRNGKQPRKRSNDSGGKIIDLRSESLPQDLIDYQNAIEKKQHQMAQQANESTTSPFASSFNGSYNAGIFNNKKSPVKRGGHQLISEDSDSDSETDFDAGGTKTILFGGSSSSSSSSSNAARATGVRSPTSASLNASDAGVDDISPDTGLTTSATESQVAREFMLAIYVIVVVQVLAQITGSNVIRNYAPTIFEASGVSSNMSLVYNVILGVVKLLFTACSVWYIDTSGRRTLFLVGICVVGGGMLFLSLASLISSLTSTSHIQGPITYTIGCSLVYAGFGISYGPIPWILSSELFPTVVRGRIMSISLIASNVSQLLTNMVFLLMQQYLTTAGTFGFFFGLNVLALVYVFLFVVETKELSPSDILVQLRLRQSQAGKRLKYMMCCGLCGGGGLSATGLVGAGGVGGEHQQLYSQLNQQTQEPSIHAGTTNVLHGCGDVERGVNSGSGSGSSPGKKTGPYSAVAGGAGTSSSGGGGGGVFTINADDDEVDFDSSRHDLVRISQSEDDYDAETNG